VKLGVLGGTFDPVHNGHLLMAERARDALGLDRVMLMPAGTPMSKPGRRVTPPGHRLLMLRRAVEGRDKLSVSVIELDRPGPSYTVDTLRELRRRYGEEAALYFILGSDSLALLPSWYEPAEIISLSRLAVVPRPDFPVPPDAELDRLLPGLAAKVDRLKEPVGEYRATGIRDLARRKQPIDHLVPPAVADYISTYNIYSGGDQ
jgi:nicotinate-nucleotide adenylyltransferase